MQTGEFIAFRTTPAIEGAESPRTKQYARRSKRGCATCRRRHVRCDENRPICQRCTRAQLTCVYAQEPTVNRRKTGSSQPQSSLSVFKSPDELADLQFWLEIGGSNVGRWQCPIFYDSLLPQFGQAHESVRYSLLALSTCVRQWHLRDDNARTEVLRRGDRYYSLACEQLLRTADLKPSIEAALISSLALFFFDSFTDNMGRRYIHSNAAISFLQSLKRGLSYNEVSGWRSESGRVGAQVVIEAAEAYLDDISYSIAKDHINREGTEVEDILPSRKKLYDPIWLQLDPQSTALMNDQFLLKPEPVESPSDDWWIIPAAPTSIRECHIYLTLWHNWMFTWLINASIPTHDLQNSRRLCSQWHEWLFGVMQPGSPELLSMQTRALILDGLFELKLVEQREGDTRAELTQQLERILTLIMNNVRMSRQISGPETGTSTSRFSKYGARQYLRGLAKVLEYVLRRTNNPRTKEQAYGVFSFQLSDDHTHK